jgi:hypothetical protein
VFTWDVQTLTLVYMTFVVYGQYLWLCIYGYVYGYVFTDCVYGCVFMGLYGYVSGCMDVCLWLCVYGYVYGYRVLISREAWFINVGAYLSLGPVSVIIGIYSSVRPISANIGTYSSTRPISTKPWDLLLHEAHLDDSSNFFNFSSTRMEKFAPVCSVE